MTCILCYLISPAGSVSASSVTLERETLAGNAEKQQHFGLLVIPALPISTCHLKPSQIQFCFREAWIQDVFVDLILMQGMFKSFQCLGLSLFFFFHSQTNSIFFPIVYLGAKRCACQSSSHQTGSLRRCQPCAVTVPASCSPRYTSSAPWKLLLPSI